MHIYAYAHLHAHAACIHARRVACRATGKAKVVAGSALANAGSSVQGLAELLASLNLTQHLGAADAWCVDRGAEDAADLKDEDLAEQLAEVL